VTVGGNPQRAATLSVNDWGSSIYNAIIVPKKSHRGTIRRNHQRRTRFTPKTLLNGFDSAPPALQQTPIGL
jgi:hypothetical protein